VAEDVELLLGHGRKHFLGNVGGRDLARAHGLCDMARATFWLPVSVALLMSAGRLRSLSAMPVGTKYGHSRLQCTWSVTRRRSWYRSRSAPPRRAC
jgi:hypothetical protein